MKRIFIFWRVDSLKLALFGGSHFFGFFDVGNTSLQVLKLGSPFSPHTPQALLFDSSSADTLALSFILEKHPDPLVLLRHGFFYCNLINLFDTEHQTHDNFPIHLWNRLNINFSACFNISFILSLQICILLKFVPNDQSILQSPAQIQNFNLYCI